MGDGDLDRPESEVRGRGDEHKVGVLVLRACRPVTSGPEERGATTHVHARVRACLDITDGRQELVVADGIDAINAAVADWLARFAAGRLPEGPL
jgi:hypothetical protein